MSGSYDPILVGLSIALAIFASFTALDLAGRIRLAEGAGRAWWLGAAAATLGTGIWSMHFVGMLAFRSPVAVSYDVNLTLLSLLTAIVFVGLGFAIVARFGTGWRPLAAAGLLTGLGIVAMHYIGMLAMRMPGMTITFRPAIVALSVAIAVLAAVAALWLAFRARRLQERLAAAVVMGLAISGMHYTGMAAAVFQHAGLQTPATHAVIDENLLAVAVAGATTMLLILGLLGAFFDRKLAALTAREAELLQESERRFRALVENASDIILITDRVGRITYESGSAEHILGYREDGMVGHRLVDLAPEEMAGRLGAFYAALSTGAGHSERMELRLRAADGGWRDFEATAKNLAAEPGIGGIVVNLRDITERKRLLEALERLSETDPLTATLNRRGFLKVGEREMERARRRGEPLPVVMVDIDHFKQVNDMFGHAAGDLVLARVAEICRTHTRAVDVLSRFGGEEFVILLVDSAVGSAEVAIERLRVAIEAARVHSIRGDVRVTASFGLAIVDPKECDLERAVRLADEALYEAKSAGRNCIRIRAVAG